METVMWESGTWLLTVGRKQLTRINLKEQKRKKAHEWQRASCMAIQKVWSP